MGPRAAMGQMTKVSPNSGYALGFYWSIKRVGAPGHTRPDPGGVEPSGDALRDNGPFPQKRKTVGFVRILVLN